MSLTMLDGDKFKVIESERYPQIIRGILPAAKDFALRIRRWINEAGDDDNNEDYFDSLRENLNKVWRKQDGWTTTVSIFSEKLRSSRLK